MISKFLLSFMSPVCWSGGGYVYIDIPPGVEYLHNKMTLLLLHLASPDGGLQTGASRHSGNVDIVL